MPVHILSNEYKDLIISGEQAFSIKGINSKFVITNNTPYIRLDYVTKGFTITRDTLLFSTISGHKFPLTVPPDCEALILETIGVEGTLYVQDVPINIYFTSMPVNHYILGVKEGYKITGNLNIKGHLIIYKAKLNPFNKWFNPIFHSALDNRSLPGFGYVTDLGRITYSLSPITTEGNYTIDLSKYVMAKDFHFWTIVGNTDYFIPLPNADYYLCGIMITGSTTQGQQYSLNFGLYNLGTLKASKIPIILHEPNNPRNIYDIKILNLDTTHTLTLNKKFDISFYKPDLARNSFSVSTPSNFNLPGKTINKAAYFTTDPLQKYLSECQITKIETSKTNVNINEEYQVIITVTNSGDIPQTRNIKLLVNKDFYNRYAITIPPNTTEIYKYTLNHSTDGNYEICAELE